MFQRVRSLIRQTNVTPSAGDFLREEIPCANEAAAKALASSRQVQEPDGDRVEWIYLRNTQHQWVARRTLRDGSADQDGDAGKGRLEAVVDAAIDTLHPENFFLN